jgi:pimeloyl-ACP methyl ester carboxylesterase
MVAIVGAEGDPGWRVVRVALVAVLTFGALRAGAVPSIAHGIVGVTVGVAIGLRHLSEEGMSLDTVAGLVALVAGVVLLVRGLRALVRNRVLFVVALLASLFVVFNAFPSVMVTNVPDLPLGSARPAVAYDDVRFTTSDGVRIAAWWVPSRNGAAVVLRHGSGSTRASVVPHVDVLAEAGYGVLATDARGHGESGGRAMDFGWYGDRDIAAALDFVTTRDGVDPTRIGVVGMSMGGEEAIGAAAADDRIRAVVAEGATARQAEDKEFLSESHGVRGDIQGLFDRGQDMLTALLTSAPRPTVLRAAVGDAATTPFLVIAAGKVAEEQDAAEWFKAEAPDRVDTWTIDGAAHTDGVKVDRAEWARRVTAFLARALD